MQPARVPEDAVVVGVGADAECSAAIGWAADEAVRRGARLEVVHAYLEPFLIPGAATVGDVPGVADLCHTARAGAQAVLDDAVRAVRERHPGLPVVPHALVGSPASVLLAAAAQAALVAVGDRGRGALHEALFGSVGPLVAAHARCPTALVRGDTGRDGPVVVGVDDVAAADAPLRFAITEAARRDAPVIVMHASDAVCRDGDLRASADLSVREAPPELADAWRGRHFDERLAVHLESAGLPAADIGTVVVAGDDAAAALTRASADAALVVIGAPRPHGIAALRAGPHIRRLMRHAECPVVVVPDRYA